MYVDMQIYSDLIINVGPRCYIGVVGVKEAKQHRRSLLTVWLDYKKAFDSVPHSWILESLRLAKVPSAIVDAINFFLFC